ncbi:MAG: CPBP family intramembrane glutamic endopeptidase [Planctomycetota bacterium]
MPATGEDPPPRTLRPDDATDTFGLYQQANDAYRAPLTVLTILMPLGLIAEIYRFMWEPANTALPLFTGQWQALGNRLGLQAPLVPVALLTAGGLAVQALSHHPWELPRRRTVLLVCCWGALWALVRYMVALATISVIPAEAATAPPLEQALALAGLAISAALQEELVFRALVLGVLGLSLRALGWGRWSVYAICLPLSAALFSVAHTTVFHPAAGEAFAWSAFTHRFLAGLLYGTIFIRQGLAVSTLAHAGYNAAALFGLGPL